MFEELAITQIDFFFFKKKKGKSFEISAQTFLALFLKLAVVKFLDLNFQRDIFFLFYLSTEQTKIL